MKKVIVRIVLALVLVVIALLVVGVLFLDKIVKTGVEKVGPIVAKVPVTLQSANISILGGSGKLNGFVLGNPEGYKSTEAVKVGSVFLSLAPMSVLGDKVLIHSIKVESPEITYETDLRTSNLNKILDNMNSGEKKPADDTSSTKGKGAERKLQVDEFVISGAKVHVASKLGSMTLPIPDIKLINLGQGPEGITATALSKQVMNEIVAATTKAVMENAGKLGKSLEGVGSGSADGLKKAGSSLKDLFKTK